jgi:hypothetical protein
MRLYYLLPLVSVLVLSAQETPTTLKDQQSLAVTIYNSNLALVKDQREVRLPKGPCQLAFQDVSALIRPETAILANLTFPKDFWIEEQNFDFDLLTPEKLLEKYVGEKVTVIGTRPKAKGEGQEEFREDALVLATNNGVVLQFADRIETSVPGRIVYPKVPANLRARPTLAMSLHSGADRAQKLELSYLTEGLSWEADYAVSLSHDEKTMDISGWVTLTNESGTAYPNATLQLVVGDVNIVSGAKDFSEIVADAADEGREMAKPEMEEETLFDYHLYTLDRPTTLKENQTKQVVLLSASGLPVRKEYLLYGQRHFFTSSYGAMGEKPNIGLFVYFENSEESHLGKPLPAGVMRVYKKDSRGGSQFVGEDSIDHTPKNEEVGLRLGSAFDVTGSRRRTDFKRLPGAGKRKDIYESAFEVVLKNAKNEAVTVTVLEPLFGDWEILEKSHAFTKETSGTAKFMVNVPAEGSATLKYRARVRL